MAHRVEGSFDVTSWNEGPVEGLGGTVKVTRASIGQRFSGGIDADTVADMVMTYREDGTADFAGYQRVVGRIGDREGTFVLQGLGEFDGSEARTRLEVVRDSGTGGLVGLRGSGLAAAPMGATGTYHLDYEL